MWLLFLQTLWQHFFQACRIKFQELVSRQCSSLLLIISYKFSPKLDFLFFAKFIDYLRQNLKSQQNIQVFYYLFVGCHCNDEVVVVVDIEFHPNPNFISSANMSEPLHTQPFQTLGYQTCLVIRTQTVRSLQPL